MEIGNELRLDGALYLVRNNSTRNIISMIDVQKEVQSILKEGSLDK